MITLERAVLSSRRYFNTPSNIEAHGEAPERIFVRSIFCAYRTHFGWKEKLTGRIYISKEQAATYLNSIRSYGVGFEIHQVPLMILEYKEVSIGVHVCRKYSKYGYSRILYDFEKSWPNFWQHFPDLRADWLFCFPIQSTSPESFPIYRKEAFRSHFLGADFPIQWEAHHSMFEKGYFETFLSFCRKVQELNK